MADVHSSAGHTSHAGESHGSVASYRKGFYLSVGLTVLAFVITLSHGLSPEGTIRAIAALAAVQIFVHLVYFLHLNSSSEQRWNVTAFAFTVLSVVILIVGTMWIMANVGMNMMSR
ncbi:MAG TPA: cytochrome o ubiquinol oxidase subunit IV [Acetobacteraceae bacterium]|nr:cytochrome o ubiquinol oxidase subunit IV [Acetobacteraceae bacterium]